MAGAPTISQLYDERAYERAMLEDSSFRVGHQEIVAWIRTLYENRRGPKRILEVGAGTGLLTERLAREFPGAEISALEPDELWFQSLRSRVDGFGGVRCYLSSLEEFRETRFDICCSSVVFHHFAYSLQPWCVEHMWDVLRTNGHVIVFDKFIAPFFNELERRIALYAYHGFFLAWNTATGLVARAGFEKRVLVENLAQRGEYKIALPQLRGMTKRYFDWVGERCVGPFDDGPSPESVVAVLLAEGFSLSRRMRSRVAETVAARAWGNYVCVARRRERLLPG